jgi:hypothetical protein
MTDDLHSGNKSPWTGSWRCRLQSELGRAGFGSLEEFLEANPGRGYVARARQLANANVAPLQIFGEQLRLGMANQRLRSVAMDSLVRYIIQYIPRGWRNGVHFRLRAASAFSTWSTSFPICTQEMSNLSERLHSVLDTLEAMDIPQGWLPKDVSDRFLAAAFATGWPAHECGAP